MMVGASLGGRRFELCEVKNAKDPILVFEPVAIAPSSDFVDPRRSICKGCHDNEPTEGRPYKSRARLALTLVLQTRTTR